MDPVLAPLTTMAPLSCGDSRARGDQGRGGTAATKREWLRVWQQLRQQQRTVEKLSPLKILEQEMGSNEVGRWRGAARVRAWVRW